MKSPEVSKEALARAIRELHGCEATWIESVPVKEVFEGETVWEGIVQVFSLIGHPTATRSYAWSHLVDDSGKRKFFAVLHQGPVDSPRAAVRAAIVAEHRKKA
ncbi:MAG: hypothetical protein FJ118_08010 [Deltaproteobacteria bacterium]|nr:hypothetical protein [Deltaproteobacteria bacterium]